MPKPFNLYTAAQTRQLDDISINRYGIAGLCLMERAAFAVFQRLQQHIKPPAKVCVLAGAGNNAGDGFVVARLAHLAGYKVDVLLLSNSDNLHGDALQTYHYLQATGIQAQAFEAKPVQQANVIVDALLGTGLSRDVSGVYQQAIETANASPAFTLAIDIPSGLDADTGCIRGCAIQADATVSFIGLKAGLLTAEGVLCCGQLHFDDLAIPAAVYATVASDSQRLDWQQLQRQLKPRPANAHKGFFGHVLVIGGERGFIGAAQLAATAAARSGAGLISIATRKQHAALMQQQHAEIMSHGVKTAKQLKKLIKKADVLAIGTGLGQSDWAKTLLKTAIHSKKPLVIDADGLNLLAQQPQRVPQAILTPHVGEAARLLDCDNQTIQANRFLAVKKIQQHYGGICILKGAGSLIYSGENAPIYLCDKGNAGMASGGMGDVLTGIIAALWAQGHQPLIASQLAVYTHALAADRAAQAGQRGLLASDLFVHLRDILN